MKLSSATYDVTVIIPAYNSVDTLERAITSVTNQTVRPKSVIVIDDNSSDNTYSLALQLAKNTSEIEFIVLKNARNLGPGLTRNVGWDLAQSKYLAFLDADDAWDLRKLEVQVGWMESHPAIDLTCTQTRFYQGVQEMNYSTYSTAPVNLRRMLFKNPIPTRTVVLRLDITERFRRGLSEDFALWTELLRNGKQITKLEVPLAIHFRPEFAPGGVSSALFTHERYEIVNIVRNFKFEPSLVPAAVIFSTVKFIRRLLINSLRKAKP
jgi:glycosyltransferase involved in cell wall biosynthesis